MIPGKKIWALCLSAALIVTQLPAVAMAENKAPEDKSIVSFEPLDSDVATQTVDVGTDLSELNLPDTIKAVVCHVTEDAVIPDTDPTEGENSQPSTAGSGQADEGESGNHAGDSSEKDSGNIVTSVTTSKEELSITWSSVPAYDGTNAGSYVFTADLDGYSLPNSVKLPQITVMVTADMADQTPANEALMKNIIGWTFVATDYSDYKGNEIALPGVSTDNQADLNTVVSMLPTQLTAKISGKAAPEALDITNWSCAEYRKDGQGRWPLAGDYTFTATLPEGYSCETLPTVKVLLGGANTYTETTQGGLTVTASNGGQVQYTDGNGFTLKTNGTYEISGTWKGTMTESVSNAVITVPDDVNADVVLSNAIIIVNSQQFCAFSVSGEANITLIGKNTLVSGHSRAGLEVPKNAAVTIGGSGSLTVTGGTSAAGIGGSNSYNYESDAGSITIIDGTVEAIGDSGGSVDSGGAGGAGIGGGNGGSGGTTKISGGKVTAKGGSKGAGIGGGFDGDGGTIIINEGSNVTAQGGEYAAGIGGGFDGDGQKIEISGGTVTATGGSSSTQGCGAGIGGGGGIVNGGRSGGHIIISGGTVTATGGRYAAGIGGGGGTSAGGDGGHITISGGILRASGDRYGAGIGGGSGGGINAEGGGAGVIEISGNTVVFATAPGTAAHIGSGGTYINKGTASGSLTQGVVFAGEQGTVHGSLTLPDNMTIPSDHTLTVPDGSVLTIPNPLIVTNHGTIENNGTINGSGTLENNGVVNDHSNGISVAVSGTKAVNKPSGVSITLWKNGQEMTEGKAVLHDTITVLAKVSQKNTRMVKAAPDQIIFKTGNTVLGTADVANGTAELSLTLTEDFWKPGSYQITAEYGGGTGLLPNSAGTADLTVEMVLSEAAAGVKAPAAKAMPDSAATVDGNAGYTVQKVTWSGNLATDGSFKYNTAYTAEITLHAKQYYRFASPLTGTINGKTAAVNLISDTEAVLSYTFQHTESKTGSDSSAPEPQVSYILSGDNISQTISRLDLKKLADSGKSLTLRCDKAGMTLEPAALKAVLAAAPAAAGSITFAAVRADLSAFPDSAAQLGARPAYDFTISYIDSTRNPVPLQVNFPAGTASITLNYAPSSTEVTGNLFIVYVDGRGAMTWIDKSSYDSGRVLAEISHFSVYGVAFKAPEPVFTDITEHWAKEDIAFVTARGLLGGIDDSLGMGNNLFSPDGIITRGMLVTSLGRLAGINPESYQTRSFTDVKADSYYAAYVEWAAQKNIVKETSEGLWSPDTPVTREQMAVIMENYTRQMGYSIPAPLAAVTFTDNGLSSTWAAKEVDAMYRAGIIKGRDGNRFDPQAGATRAEVSAVLHRFVEVIIDPATATGWEKNDSGHWLYYKGRYALTGWQTIDKLLYCFNADGVMHEGWKQDTDTNQWYYFTNSGAATGWREIGGKWYYFDENGIMAVNTKVDGYEVGPDGAWKTNN